MDQKLTTLGGMYALIGAHLAQLALNWHNDALIIRQRLNFFGTDVIPPNVVASSHFFFRGIRLFMAILILATTLSFEWCTSKDVICDSNVSHATHTFGALFGFFSGCIFLRVRSSKPLIRITQNILRFIIYGVAALCIFGMYMKKEEEPWCPWMEYERKCQDWCYRKDYSQSADLCKNVNFTICYN